MNTEEKIDTANAMTDILYNVLLEDFEARTAAGIKQHDTNTVHINALMSTILTVMFARVDLTCADTLRDLQGMHKFMCERVTAYYNNKLN